MNNKGSQSYCQGKSNLMSDTWTNNVLKYDDKGDQDNHFVIFIKLKILMYFKNARIWNIDGLKPITLLCNVFLQAIFRIN